MKYFIYKYEIGYGVFTNIYKTQKHKNVSDITKQIIEYHLKKYRQYPLHLTFIEINKKCIKEVKH